jgi:iron complex outermembrane receptor protein
VVAQPSVSTPLVFSLDPVEVAARRADPANRHRPVAVDVIEGNALAERSASTVSAALNGVVPGVWIWPLSTGLIAQYGSMRGASSFGPSAPRVFIDGIEVANPLLLTQLSADAIERIEVVRGPQGAAWFGTNAVNGVTNIVTRHDIGGGGPRFRLRSAVDVSATAFAPSSPIGQEHSFSFGLGSAARSAVLNAAFGTNGAVVPGGGARQLSADGSFRHVGAQTLVTATARFLARDVGTPVSPLLPDSLPWHALPGGLPEAGGAEASVGVRQYTAGVKAEFAPGQRWRHALVVGIDGYSLDGIDGFLPLSSAADSALRAAGTGALRGTLRWTSLARTEFGDLARGSLTLTAEHTRLRAYSRASWQSGATGQVGPWNAERLVELLARPAQTGYTTSVEVARTALNTTGLGARGSLDVLDHISLTGGFRLELSDNDTGIGRFAVLPTLGGTVYGDAGPLAITLRAAYGKGVRWPELPAAPSSWGQLHSLYLMPAPEEQAGIEAGFDVSWQRRLSLQVTRFDQTATGLIQRVKSDEPGEARRQVTLQNVGSISNRGWEVAAKATRGPLSIGAAATIVDSRVRAVAADHTGDLRPGDRMLAVPAHTIGLTAAWHANRWAASVSAQRAGNWINYDRIALARMLAERDEPRLPDGDLLRTFWRRYEGVTHLNATFRHDLPRGLVLLIGAENLLNIQVGEPDNITVLPGRTFTLGIRASF